MPSLTASMNRSAQNIFANILTPRPASATTAISSDEAYVRPTRQSDDSPPPPKSQRHNDEPRNFYSSCSAHALNATRVDSLPFTNGFQLKCDDFEVSLQATSSSSVDQIVNARCRIKLYLLLLNLLPLQVFAWVAVPSLALSANVASLAKAFKSAPSRRQSSLGGVAANTQTKLGVEYPNRSSQGANLPSPVVIENPFAMLFNALPVQGGIAVSKLNIKLKDNTENHLKVSLASMDLDISSRYGEYCDHQILFDLRQFNIETALGLDFAISSISLSTSLSLNQAHVKDIRLAFSLSQCLSRVAIIPSSSVLDMRGWLDHLSKST
jgi:hypothetical protein